METNTKFIKFLTGRFKQVIALSTAVCFIFTGVFADISGAAISDIQQKKSSANNMHFITMPSEGTVTKAVDFGSDEIIVNIQDLHGHAQTQRNIAKIINYIDAGYNLDSVYLEGAYGNIDTSWLSQMAKNKLGKRIIEDLVDAGKMGGAEYYSVINSKNKIITGIEDKELYETNIKLLNKIIDLQPEIDEICSNIEREISSVKKEYFNKDTAKLDRLVKRHKDNKISAAKYYNKLSKIILKNGIDLNEYKNVFLYTQFLSRSKNIDLKKVSEQFQIFVNILKSEIEYEKYMELSKNSNNFRDIENISKELQNLAVQNKIFEKHNLEYLKNFFLYLDFSGKINLIEFVQEEKKLLNRVYEKISKNQYEREVAFLYAFAPSIREYFSANITAEDYFNFRNDFKQFVVLWNSYFAQNTAKNLNKYEDLLFQYHENNIKRDLVFADKIISETKNPAKQSQLSGNLALENLRATVKNKKIKIVITGGFHSRGLEKTAVEKNISYIQITPKITKDISPAGKIHRDTIRNYREILENTINAKPLSQTWINVLFPEIMEKALIAAGEIPEFSQLDAESRKELLHEVVDIAIKENKSADDKTTVFWTIENLSDNKLKITAKYSSFSDSSKKEYAKEYIFDGKVLKASDEVSKSDKDNNKNPAVFKNIQSVFDNLFKNAKTLVYDVYTGVIAPVWEEFVFRFIPFFIAGNIGQILPVSISQISAAAALSFTAFSLFRYFISDKTELKAGHNKLKRNLQYFIPFFAVIMVFANPLSALPVIITAAISVFSFSYAHTLADKFIFKKDSQTQIRDWKNFLMPSVLFTGIYAAVYFSLYGILPVLSLNIIALFVSTAAHSIYNYLALKGKIKRPVAEIFKDSQDKTDIDEKIQKLITSLDLLIRNKEYALKTYFSNFENKGYSLASEIKNLKYELSIEKNISDDQKKEIFEKTVKRLYDIMISCVLQSNGEEFDDRILTAKAILNCIYEDSVYIKDAEGVSLFETITDFAIRQKKMFMKYDSIRLTDIIDSFYYINPELAKIILKACYDSGFFRDSVPGLKSIRGFELAKFFYTTVSDDGGGIIIPHKDEPLLSKKELKSFIKNDENINNVNISLNDTISRLQYLFTLDVFKKDKRIHEITRKVTETLKNASDLSNEEKYKIISSQINYLVKEFINADTDVNIFLELIPVILLIRNEDKPETLAVTLFNAVLKSRIPAGFIESISYPHSINTTDFLCKLSSRIFLTDKQQGLDLIKELAKNNFFKYGSYNVHIFDLKTRDDAYKHLPYGWQDVLKTYSDLELFYDALDIPYEELNEKSTIYERLFYKPDYLRVLENMMPESVIKNIKVFSVPPSYFRTKKKHLSIKAEDKKHENKFDIFNYILENNILALSELNKASKDSLFDTIVFLERMITALKKFDTNYHPYGKKAQQSLDAIKKQLKPGRITPEIIKTQSKLKLWSSEKIDDIDTVHTLINAVHQTAISVFMRIIGEDIKKDQAEDISVNPHEQASLKILNFSEDIRYEVKDFIAKISTQSRDEYGVIYKEYGVLYVNDGKILYNKKLGAHSVSIFIDFDNPNESIMCSFYDSGRSDGNAMRTTLLAMLFAKAGFDITSFDSKVSDFNEGIPGICELKAVWRCESDTLRKGEIFAEYFSRAFSIVRNTTDLDYNLQGLEYDNDKNFYHKFAIPQFTLEDFRKLKNTKENPENVVKNYEQKKKTMTLSSALDYSFYSPYKKYEPQKDEFESVYDYFSLEGRDRNIENVERMYAQGAIVKNRQTGYLEINEKYKPMSKIIEVINGNEWTRDLSFKQAQLLNLIDYSKINFKTEGYIGSMIVKSGIIKISQGWLCVKAVADAERERMQMAFVEYVDVDGNRTELDYEELINMLKKNGYEVERQGERSRAERKKTIDTLHEDNPFMKETPSAKGTGLSVGNGNNVIGKVAYDENNLNPENIWIARQITQESVDQMDAPAGFCITSGGLYSHASVVAREKNKPALLLQTNWADNEIEIRYYSYKGPAYNEGGLFVRETAEHTQTIKSGDIVLINPETGELLLFNGADKKYVEEIQKIIDGRNAPALRQYLKKKAGSLYIGRLVEYVYFQCIGNKQLEDILNVLVTWENDDEIGFKIDELSNVYKNNKLQTVRGILANIEKTEDIKEAFVLIKNAEKQIDNIVLRKNGSDIENIKRIIAEKKREILSRYIRYINDFQTIAGRLIKKDKLTGGDFDIAVKLVEMAKYWKYFYGFDGIKDLTDELDKKIQENLILKDAQNPFAEVIKPFSLITPADKLKFGSKTTELAKIKNKQGYDFKIPFGMGAGTGVLEIFFKDAGKFKEYELLMNELEDIIRSKDISRFEKGAEIAGQISEMINSSDSPQLEKYIDNLADLKDEKRYAVRSSGVGEDGANYSFAGMAATKLNRNRSNVYFDIKEVWESFFTREAVKYMIMTGQTVKPAVLIQEFVENIKSAGVVFSSDANGDFNMEIVRGIGEGLVSGKIDPDHIKVFSRDGRIEYKRALQNKKKIIALPGGGTNIEKLENKEKINRITDESIIRKMAELVYALSREAGCPVDVEFAIDNEDNIFILQRRPDTAFNSKIDIVEAEKEIEKAKLSVQSIADSFLNKIKMKNRNLYRLITVSVVPAAEELIFRFIPFFAFGTIIANPLSVLPVIITAAISVFSFSYAHTLADKFIFKKAPKLEIRDWKNFLIPSVLFTGLYAFVYLSLSCIFPVLLVNVIALFVSTAVHSIYNMLAVKEKIKRPVAEIFKDSLDKTDAEKTIQLLKNDIFENNPSTVCFVCMGNTDRSPVAQMLFKSLMRKNGKTNIKVVSAGTHTSNSDLGMPLKSEHVFELKKYGIDDDILKDFTSKSIEPQHLKSDYFIVAGIRQKNILIKKGVLNNKIITFAELAPNLLSSELPDPYGSADLNKTVTALINLIIERNFSQDALLKEPEKLSAINEAIIADLINYLRSISDSVHKNDINNIVQELSQITSETPDEQQNNIIFEQLINLKSIIDGPKNGLFLKIVPLASVVKNPQTGQLLISEFADLLAEEKEKIDKNAPLNSEKWVSSQYSNLRIIGLDMFEVAYSVNKKNALEAAKVLYRLGFIDNKELPWSFSQFMKEYDDVRKYFIAIAKPGIDKDMLEGLNETIAILKNIQLQDEDTQNEKDTVIKNLSLLFDVINPSTAQIVEHQVHRLADVSLRLLKSNRHKEAAELINAVIPVCRQISVKTRRLNEKTIKDFAILAEKFYSANETDAFNTILSYLLFVAENSDFEDLTRINQTACQHICEITDMMYKSAQKFEEKSPQYIKTENEILAIFKNLAQSVPSNLSVYRYMFDNLGFTTETLSVFIDALNKSGLQSVPYLPEDEKIINSKDIIELILQPANGIIVERLCLRLYQRGPNGKKTALDLIDKLFNTAEDLSVSAELRKNAAVLLGRTASLLYKYINDEQIMNINRINNLYDDLAIDAMLYRTESYLDNIYGRKRENAQYSENFDFTPLLAKLPKSVIEKAGIKFKSPVFIETRGRINKQSKEVSLMTDDFDALQALLEQNIIVLERIKKINGHLKRTDFDKILDGIRKMIDIFKRINAGHGNDCETSLNKILQSLAQADLDTNTIKKLFSISKWNADAISDIAELHTLINAIHQTGIADFKQKVNNIRDVNKQDIPASKFIRDNITILAYNLSDDGKMNSDIKRFLTKLASGRVSIEDFVFRDDILVWTTRLFMHSVDVFINFGEKDRGISIYYNENGRSPGYSARVRYFASVLKHLGFDVVADTEDYSSDANAGTCGLKAVLNKDSGLHEQTDIVEIAAKVISLYKHSTNIDLEFEDIANQYSRSAYMGTLDELVDKFLAGEIWYGYNYESNGKTAFREEMMLERFPKPVFSFIKQMFDKIFEYLEIEKINGNIPANTELTQSIIDKYINNPIEASYDAGRIILNEDGDLIKHVDSYAMISNFLEDIEKDEYDILRQSRIINLLSIAKFNFKTVGFVGKLMFVTGSFRLSNGKRLFVRGLMNPYTRRLKYAQTEIVSYDERIKLNTNQLTDLLNKEGYGISLQQELIGDKERQRLRSFLSAQIKNTDTPGILCTGTSDGKGTYVVGNIVYDRAKAGPNDILAVRFTTPEDLKIIESVKAVITTGGGTLSHAAITTRELKKPSVILNGTSWEKGAIETVYYTYEEPLEGSNIRKVKENDFILEQGTRILVNGETGHILVFNGIEPELLNELQKYIDSKDIEGIKTFLNKNKNNDNIKKLVEYIYFQTIGDKELEKIMFVLFDSSLPDNIREKVKELNIVYVKDKFQSITEVFAHSKKIDNINIRYNIINGLYDKINYIKTIENRQDLNDLKKDIAASLEEIKDSLLSYISDMIKKGNALAVKNNLTKSDIEDITKMIHQILVYRYFIGKTEERKDLLEKRLEIENIVSLLEKRIRQYQLSKNTSVIDSHLCSFNEISQADIYKFGSKTTELAGMYRLLAKTHGVKVPAGFGISTDVIDMYFAETGQIDKYKQLIAGLEQALRTNNSDSAKRIAIDIQNLIENSKGQNKTNLQKEIESKIKSSLNGGIRYSVRSSGVGEDSENKAFAGMGETKLNVKYEKIFDSILECWKSFYSDKSVEYMIDSKQFVKPAVLIQEMVNVDKSGVVFSRNKYGRAIIESVYGLGEGLVSGMITPDRVEAEMATGEILEYWVADKSLKIISKETGTDEGFVPSIYAKARVLNSETVKRLMDIVRILEEDAGYPIDIEYGIKDDEIYILQRRPITTFVDNSSSAKKIQENENIEDISENSISSPKQMAALVFENIPKDREILFNIANPSKQDEAISVYLKKKQDGIAVFAVDLKYSGVVDSEEILVKIVQRINTDSVVRNKFNGLSVTARVGEMEMGILPFPYIDSGRGPAIKKENSDINNIKKILMSA